MGKAKGEQAGVSVHMANANGGRNVSVGLNGVRALIQSDGPEMDSDCLRVALVVADVAGTVRIHDAQLAQRDAEIGRLRSTCDLLQSQRDCARSTLDAALVGHRRFNGPVLCRPHTRGDWSGAVWLLDPEKQESGFGLLFGSLSEVRKAHPELWIADVRDDGVLLDAAPLARSEAS